MPMLRLWKVLGTIKPIGQSACQSLVNCQCVPIHPIPIFPFSMQLSHNRKYRSLWNMPQSFCQNHTIPTLLCKAWHPSHAAGLVEPIHKHRKNATRFFLGTQQGGCEYKNHAPTREGKPAGCLLPFAWITSVVQNRFSHKGPKAETLLSHLSFPNVL